MGSMVKAGMKSAEKGYGLVCEGRHSRGLVKAILKPLLKWLRLMIVICFFTIFSSRGLQWKEVGPVRLRQGSSVEDKGEFEFWIKLMFKTELGGHENPIKPLKHIFLKISEKYIYYILSSNLMAHTITRMLSSYIKIWNVLIKLFIEYSLLSKWENVTHFTYLTINNTNLDWKMKDTREVMGMILSI